jgi:hypothetical protein
MFPTYFNPKTDKDKLYQEYHNAMLNMSQQEKEDYLITAVLSEKLTTDQALFISIQEHMDA